ncbi:unnamed protein product [Tetraodon nigroviridis]|uniref:(spotted green pufferfish) hypothetical protein n=1 Tax=Tetraodon nigroviridis TaxID=99883 RepID=Q4SZX1_TETNG|nr:unnamed protein product [Tetraodon nigroviridis]
MTTGSAKHGPEGDPQTPAVAVLSRPYISNKPYQCAICRVSYNHAITLESHMKSVLHQSRCRNAGIAAQGANSAVGCPGSGATPTQSAAVSTSAVGNSQADSTTAGPTSGTLVVAAASKGGEQVQSSHVSPSLLTSPVASAQAMSAFLTLLTSSPNTLSHSLLPSLFASGAASGAAVPQLMPQPQMLMPLVLNGLQAQTQQHLESPQGQLLTQCVPFVGLSTAQQALLTQRLCSLQSQWPSSGAPAVIPPSPEEQKQTTKLEAQQEAPDKNGAADENGSDQNTCGSEWSTEDVKAETHKQNDDQEMSECPDAEGKLQAERKEDDEMEHRDGDSFAQRLETENGKSSSRCLSPVNTERGLPSKTHSPTTSLPSTSSLSPVHLNLTLSPDSTPQKSQSGTSPCGSLGTPRYSPKTNQQSRSQGAAAGPLRSDLPALSEFQSEVLWAFLESRSEADAASPPREDCEALGREVGLSEEEVRKWLSQARSSKLRKKAADSDHPQGAAAFARHSQSSDNEFDDDEEHSLIIAEGEDDAEASGSQAIDLSRTRGKHKRKGLAKEGPADSCLTSDSENEVYTSVIVTDEESQNGSLRECPESPAKSGVPSEAPADKASLGGKVLRSTTVFLSDAEDEYEEDEGERAKRKKRKRESESDQVEVKKERQHPDVDLELEAQGDPPGSASHVINHPGALHSLPLSITPFSTQFISPYVLSLTPAVVGDGSKVPLFSNPPTITRFSDSLLPLNQARFLSNGDDCESALDLSMGKNSSKSVTAAAASSSLADKIAAQKGQLLDGLGLRPTPKGLVVVQVKPEPALSLTSSKSSLDLAGCNNVTKSNIYMKMPEKMCSSLLERERGKEKEKEQEQQQRKSKGKRYRDMRRSRTIIQAEQLDILYGCYFKDANPGKHEFEQISEWVNLPKKVVQIWFQNMRARERKGEVRFISDGMLAAVGKPLIKFTWPLSKPIFSNKPPPHNSGCVTATPIVRTLLKTEKEAASESGKPILVKKVIPVPIKPKEAPHPPAASAVGGGTSVVPKNKVETAGAARGAGEQQAGRGVGPLPEAERAQLLDAKSPHQDQHAVQRAASSASAHNANLPHHRAPSHPQHRPREPQYPQLSQSDQPLHAGGGQIQPHRKQLPAPLVQPAAAHAPVLPAAVHPAVLLRDLRPPQRNGVRGHRQRAQPASEGGADLVPEHQGQGEALEAAAGEDVASVGRTGGHELRRLPAVQRPEGQSSHPAKACPADAQRVPGLAHGRPVGHQGDPDGPLQRLRRLLRVPGCGQGPRLLPAPPGHPENH